MGTLTADKDPNRMRLDWGRQVQEYPHTVGIHHGNVQSTGPEVGVDKSAGGNK